MSYSKRGEAVTSRRAVAWNHGVLAAQTLGGMLGPVLFILPDGRQVNPLHVAFWGNEPDRFKLPGILQRLRGEWPCVPFGSDGARQLSQGWSPAGETFSGADIPHGHASNAEWQWLESDPQSLAMAIEYPLNHPVKRLTRRIMPDAQTPAIAIELAIEVRRPCRLPIGLHPVFRLPATPGAMRLEPAPYDHVRSFPGTVEPGAALFAENKRFARLENSPRRDGGEIDASALPFDPQIEDLLQLVAIQGGIALHNTEERWRARLTWQAEHFPSLLLWFSNRGRTAFPWAGKHLALGVEPVCSAFDLGPAVSCGNNPIAAEGIPTARAFTPGEPFLTRYRVAVEAA